MPNTAAPNAQTQINYGALLISWLVVLLLARWGVNAFGETDLFFDEAQYWLWSKELDWGYFSKPPMIGWVIFGTTQLCGDSSFCIRAPSALLHAGSALFIYFAGRRLFSAKVGFWASLAFATLPGISVSAHLISTDVPLLFFWSMALYAFVSFRTFKDWRDAILFGVAIGLGLLSKYAMIYGVVLYLTFVCFSPTDRWMLRSAKFWTAIAISALLILPNMIWVLNNGAITFAHTADNAGWSGFRLNWSKGAEFFTAQLGVFGPILFVTLLIIATAVIFGFGKNTDKERQLNYKLLLTLSLPIVLAITFQALMSRAHANWAATAYPAATLLVTAILLQSRMKWLNFASLGLHVAIMSLFAVGILMASTLNLPGKADPFSRLLGWQTLADKTKTIIEQTGAKTLVTDKRDLSAQMVYYLYEDEIEIFALKNTEVPNDHYEMTRPFTNRSAAPGPILYLTRDPEGRALKAQDERLEHIDSFVVQKGPKKQDQFSIFLVSSEN